jgi:hypothetical protein
MMPASFKDSGFYPKTTPLWSMSHENELLTMPIKGNSPRKTGQTSLLFIRRLKNEPRMTLPLATRMSCLLASQNNLAKCKDSRFARGEARDGGVIVTPGASLDQPQCKAGRIVRRRDARLDRMVNPADHL